MFFYVKNDDSAHLESSEEREAAWLRANQMKPSTETALDFELRKRADTE